MSATLNNQRCTAARVNVPAWGCWHAEAEVDGEMKLSAGARVTLKIADLTLSGTVLSGGPTLGRASYRIVAGAGGWGRMATAKNFVDDSGVKVSTVLVDTAALVGETMAAIAPSVRTGPAWTREADRPASDALNHLSPAAWYVDENGITHLGARAPGKLPNGAVRLAPVDLARGKVMLASESIATILPGVVVDGLTAVDVLHEVSADGGLRSTVWGGSTGSAAESVRKLVAALDPDRGFRGVTEYRVDTLSGASRLNLQPVRASSGMPYLKNVIVRPGVAGCEATYALGARVLVGFVEADPSRPYVAAGEEAGGSRFLPTALALASGVLPAARLSDTIQAGPFAGTITGGSALVKVG